jgi:RNA polymerase-interacting CarD/CdnL/TRCF family regulator
MIRIVSSGLRVMVPQSNATTVGLRSVIRSTESAKVLGFLETGKEAFNMHFHVMKKPHLFYGVLQVD